MEFQDKLDLGQLASVFSHLPGGYEISEIDLFKKFSRVYGAKFEQLAPSELQDEEFGVYTLRKATPVERNALDWMWPTIVAEQADNQIRLLCCKDLSTKSTWMVYVRANFEDGQRLAHLVAQAKAQECPSSL